MVKIFIFILIKVIGSHWKVLSWAVPFPDSCSGRISLAAVHRVSCQGLSGHRRASQEATSAEKTHSLGGLDRRPQRQGGEVVEDGRCTFHVRLMAWM